VRGVGTHGEVARFCCRSLPLPMVFVNASDPARKDHRVSPRSTPHLP